MYVQNLLRGLLPSGFQQNPPCLTLSMRATFSSHLTVLQVISLKYFGNADKLWRSLIAVIVTAPPYVA